MNTDLGPLLYSFFEDHLKCQKGLRPCSLKSYRDSLKLFLLFLAENTGHKVTRLSVADLTCARVLAFLQSSYQAAADLANWDRAALERPTLKSTTA